MRVLFIIWLILVAILVCVRLQVRVQWPAITADAQAPTATPTPTGPAMCTVTGTVVNADGSPFVNGTITFNSLRIQVINGFPVNPTVVSTTTDNNGNIQAKSLPQGLAMQITICPGTQQTANCSAPFSAIIPFSQTANFGNLAQGTALTSSTSLSLTSLNVSGSLTFPDGSTDTMAGFNNLNIATGGSLFIGGQNQFQTGTWPMTPHCSTTNPTMTGVTQGTGIYQIIGKIVFFSGSYFWNGATGGAGAASLFTLPYPLNGPSAESGESPLVDIMDTNATPVNAGNTRIVAAIGGNGGGQGNNYISLYESNFGTAGFLIPLACANAFANTPSGIFVNGWYRYLP